MKTGDVVLLPFPFAELTNKKVRPAVVVCETQDKYRDLVVSAISSVVPKKLSKNEILLQTDKHNNLRAVSIIKVDRIFTAKQQDVIVRLGELNQTDLSNFKERFKSLVE
ncbi:MAG: type II toxin-antitoxin system PemK/MazF family toxin [Pyrinomonadaceae bacterium]|nr:type II toxin-antitoxin system PemK/MazF family toxin [Pyrinomonadaceae bacterium]